MFKRAQEPLADWQNLKDEDRAKAQRLERRAWMFQNIAIAVLGASVVGTILTTRADWAIYFPFLMWVHVAIVLLACGGFFALRSVPTFGPARVTPILRELFAPWVLVAAFVAVVAAAPNWAGTVSGLEAEYDEFQRANFAIFAKAWVVFSLLGLLLWRLIALRRRDALAAASAPLASASATTSTAASAPGDPTWRSTAVIVGIWVFMIGFQLPMLTGAQMRPLCVFPTPDMGGLEAIILLWPGLFFVIGACRIKRSPLLTPWMEQLLDERLGSGGGAAFLTRLRPLLLLAWGSLLAGGVAWWSCSRNVSPESGTNLGIYFASTGVLSAIAHVIVRWRRIPGL